MVFGMMIFSSNIHIMSDVEACREFTIVYGNSGMMIRNGVWNEEQVVEELADQLWQFQFHQPGGIQGQLGS